MFYGRNRKCILHLAKRNFASAKNRNIIVVLAIVLTTVLFTSLITIGVGAYHSTQLTMQIQKGNKADAEIRYITEEQFNKLRQDSRISMVGCRRPIGFLSNSKNHNVELDYMDSIEQDLRFALPAYGEAPEKGNEVATTVEALKSLGVPEPEIGKPVTIKFDLRGKAYTFDMVLSGYWEASNAQNSFMLVSEQFIKDNQELFQYTYEVDYALAGTYFTDICFQTRDNISSQLEAVILDLGGEAKDTGADNYVANSVNNVTNPTISWSVVTAILVLAFLFVFAGYLLIYNIFEISIMQEVQRYGLLKTIGTTQKQIAFSVRIQAVWLLLIALPIGLISGFLIGKGVLPLTIQFISGEYSNLTVVANPNPIIFVLATLFTVFTVLISIRKPINIAACISPIEALKYMEDRQQRKKTKRSRRITIGGLAKENLKRNKKRTLFIIISMTLCCILLNSAFIIVNSVDIEKAIKSQCAADAIVASGNTFNNTKGYSTKQDGLDERISEVIEKTLPVKNFGRIYKNTLDDVGVTIDYGRQFDEVVNENGFNVAIEGGSRIPLGNSGYPLCNVYGVDKNVLQRMNVNEDNQTLSNNQIFELMSSGNYVVEGLENSQFTKKRSFHTKVGDKIMVYTDNNEVKQFEVIAHVLVSPTEYEVPNLTTGISKVGGDAPKFYLTTEQFKEVYRDATLMSITFDVNDSEEKNVNETLLNMVDQAEGSIGYSSVEMIRNSMNSIKDTVLIIGTIIGAILGLAGFINFINLMMTNIITRRREYAIMQSVGMTARQVKALNVIEGLLYAIIAGAIGVALSMIIGSTLMKNICSSIWFLTFQMTLWPAVIISLITILLSASIPVLILATFNRESIVEKIKTIN